MQYLNEGHRCGADFVPNVPDLTGVRNKAGFFGGVIKRFRDLQAPSLPAAGHGQMAHQMGHGHVQMPGHGMGYGMDAVQNAAYMGAPGGKMWPSVEAKLESLYR
jgi:hypothetical protein